MFKIIDRNGKLINNKYTRRSSHLHKQKITKNRILRDKEELIEPPTVSPWDSHIDSWLDRSPRQNAITGQFHHGRTDRS